MLPVPEAISTGNVQYNIYNTMPLGLMGGRILNGGENIKWKIPLLLFKLSLRETNLALDI